MAINKDFIIPDAGLQVNGAAVISSTLGVNGAVTVANTLTVGNTTITGNVNVSVAANVGGALRAGGLITGAAGADITGTVNVSTAINVGANVNLSLTNINVGNGSVNTALTQTSIATGNTTVNTTITQSSLNTGNTTVYTNIGQATALFGNSTVNTAITASSIRTGNATVFTSVNATALTTNGTLTVGGNTTLNGANLVVAGNAVISGANLVVSGFTTFQNSVTIAGDLTVSGTTTYVNTATLNIADNIITLNADVAGGSAPSENAGIEVNRGNAANVQLRWNETTDRWQITTDGTNYGNIHSTLVDVVLGTDTSGNYVATISSANGVGGSGTGEGSTPTLYAVGANGITVTTAGINVLAGTELTSNATGVHHNDITRTDTTNGNTTPNYGGTFTAVDSITTNARGHVTAVNTKTVTMPSSNNTTYDLAAVANSAANEGRVRLTDSANANDDVLFVGQDEITITSNSTAVYIDHNDITRTNTTTGNTSPNYAGTFTAVDSITTNARGHVTAVNTKTVTMPSSNNTTYDLLAVANTAVNAGLLRLSDSALSNDTVTFTGSGTSNVSSNASHIIINSADQFTGTVTSVATGNGITGGTITSTGTLYAVGGTGVTVNTSGISIGQDVATTAGVTFANVTVQNNATYGLLNMRSSGNSLISIGEIVFTANGSSTLRITSAPQNTASPTISVFSGASTGTVGAVNLYTGATPSATGAGTINLTGGETSNTTTGTAGSTTVKAGDHSGGNGGGAGTITGGNVRILGGDLTNSGGNTAVRKGGSVIVDAGNVVSAVTTGTPGDILIGTVQNVANLQIGSTNTTRTIVYANGSLGSAGQVLHSNGTATYWAADDDTNTTYDLAAVANTAANQGRIRLTPSAGSNDDIIFVGQGDVTVTSNATGVYVNSISYGIGTSANDAVNVGYIALTRAGTTTLLANVVGSDDITVFSNTSAVYIDHTDIARSNNTSTATPASGGTFTAIDSITTNARGHVTAINTKTVTLPVDPNTTYTTSTIANTTTNQGITRLTSSGNANTDTFVLGLDEITVSSNSLGVYVDHNDVSRSDGTSSASPASGGTFTAVDSVTTNARGHVTAINVKTVTLPVDPNTTYTSAAVANTAANEGRARLTSSGNANTDVLFVGQDELTVTSNSTAIYIDHNDVTRTNNTSTASPAAGGTFTAIDSITTNARGHVTAVNTKTVTLPTSTDTNTTYDLLAVANTTASNAILRLADSSNSNDNIFFVGSNEVVTSSNATHIIVDHADVARSNNTSTASPASGGTFTAIDSITTNARGHVTAINTKTVTLPVDPNTTYTGANGVVLTGTEFRANVGATLVANASGIHMPAVATAGSSSGGISAITIDAQGRVTSVTGSAGYITSIPNANTQVTSLGVGIAATGTTGEIRATNNITAYASSDKRLKENIAPIEDAVEKVSAIGGKTFDWTDEYIAQHGGEDGYFVRKADFGVIAQDVEQVFPTAVREREDGTLAVDYEKLVALAFQAIKELKAEIEDLKNNR